jgi:hypothetical protein
VITITGFGDHNQPEWLIIFTGIRKNTGKFADSGFGGASEAAKKGTKSVHCGPIPYAS